MIEFHVFVDVSAGIHGKDLGRPGVDVEEYLTMGVVDGVVEVQFVIEPEVRNLGRVLGQETADRGDRLDGLFGRDGFEEGHHTVETGEILHLGLELLLAVVETVVKFYKELLLDLLDVIELRVKGLGRERLERGGVLHGLTITFLQRTLHSEWVGPRVVLVGRDLPSFAQGVRQVVPGFPLPDDVTLWAGVDLDEQLEGLFLGQLHGLTITCSRLTLHSVGARFNGIDDIILQADYLQVFLHFKIVTINLAHPFADSIEAFKDELQLDTIQFVQWPSHILIIPHPPVTLHPVSSK